MRLAVLLALLLLPAAPARALFHLWDVVEVFSDASGDVQFVELFTSAASQQSVGAHPLRTRTMNGTTLATFTIPADLPGDSENHHFLLATPGFAAVAGIDPDFTLPAGFIELGIAAQIDFASVDLFPLAGLPSDGMSSLNRAASGGATTVADATPRNFAGQEGTIDLPEPGSSCLGLGVAATLALLAFWQARRARNG